MSTPTSRTLKLLRDMGYHAHVVERWVPQARKRIDVAGFGDILAWKYPKAPDPFEWGAMLLVQTTSGSNVAARVSKINGECAEAAKAWREAGGRIAVVGWSKKGARGKRKTWQHRWIDVEPLP